MRTDLRPDDLDGFLDEPLIAVLATRRKDDSILLSPVWFEWREGRMHVWAASEDEGKVRHIKRDPRVSIVVANADWPYRGVEVRGTATASGHGFYEILGRTARRYLDNAAAARMVESYAPGVVIRIEPEHTRAWDYAEA